MRLLLNKFGGMVPRVSPEKLPEAAAQLAQNTDLHTGNIAAFRQLGAAQVHDNSGNPDFGHVRVDPLAKNNK